MAEAVFKLDAVAIQRQLTGRDGAITRDMVRRAQRVVNAARRNCPVDQGRLRASIAYEVRGSGPNLEVRVGSNLKYAIYVEKGTGVYAGRGYIYPRSGQYLRWPARTGGGFVFARRVRGMRARPYLEPALRAAA